MIIMNELIQAYNEKWIRRRTTSAEDEKYENLVKHSFSGVQVIDHSIDHSFDQ